MTLSTFTLNDRYLVCPARNVLRDLQNKTEKHLEPRLIDLLCLLAENEGLVVTRETIISKIWNDYGGAEDGLNQAISFVRKALNDADKKIIETIPKKGYALHATIMKVKDSVANKKPHRRVAIKYAIAVMLIVISCVFYYWLRPRSGQNTATLPSLKEKNEISFTMIDSTELENHFNTITTTGTDSARYRLVAIGDRRPRFYINDQFIPESEREQYSDLIDKMLRQLWNRQQSSALPDHP